ncbi:MAG: hypothetical protein OHK0039_32740 [Bacteroidia bacterium]
MERKKIAVFIRSFSNGGAEKQSILLAKALQDRHDTWLFVLDKKPLLEKHLKTAEAAGVRLVFLEGNILRKAWTYYRFARQHKLDLSIAHLPSDTFFSAIVGRLAGVRIVMGGLRNAWVARHKLRTLRLMHNWVLSRSISNSHAGKAYLDAHGFRAAKTLVMPNGIEIAQGMMERPAPAVYEIITVGRFVAQKGYRTALQALAALHADYSLPVDVHYHIVGWGEQEAEIRQWIAELGLEAQVTVHINPPDLPELYQRAHVYLCSSDFEGLSNTVMEAMTWSLPVVATDAGDNRQLVAGGQNGYIVPIGDHAALAAGLYEVLADDNRRNDMGVSSYARIQAGYSYEAFRANYLRLVQEV